jgi:hypothetical protein
MFVNIPLHLQAKVQPLKNGVNCIRQLAIYPG